MHVTNSHRRARSGARGQILVVGVLGLLTMLGGAALILEGGNAYAQQRVVQNGSDSAANAGAVILAQRLGGATKTDAQVQAAVTTATTQNQLTSAVGRYTNGTGAYLTSGGAVTTDPAAAAVVGGGMIPSGARGVEVVGTRTFDTVLARIMGFTTFDASGIATAITGPLTGGAFIPVIFPVNITDCEGNGNTGVGESMWDLADEGEPPVGQEYIVPLCKTGEGPDGGGGSFQILDLDDELTCLEELQTPPQITWVSFPVDVPVDNGNNCATPIAEYVNANMVGEVVMIPICDAECIPTGSGSNAEYHIIKVAAFYIDYMSDENNKNNSLCQAHDGLVTIAGNGSSSCIAGWFVKWIDNGPVGTGAVGNSDAIGIQLIK